MAFKTIYPNGLGGSVADSVIVNSPFYTTGDVWYVNSSTGTDAASPAGQNRSKPLATIAQAHTNAAAGDVIVLMDGHAETLTAAQAISKRLLIVGEGQEDGLPTAQFTINHASNNMLNISGDGVEIRNVLIKPASQAHSGKRIYITGNRCRLKGVYVQCDQYDDGAAIYVDPVTTVEFDSVTWDSIAISRSAQPHSALYFSGACTHVVLRDCVVDNGTVGFSNYWAIDSVGILTDLRIENLTLTNGGDVRTTTSSVGWVGGVTATESALFNWSATDPA